MDGEIPRGVRPARGQRDWATIEHTARELRGDIPREIGESTAPLTEDHVATLVELVPVGTVGSPTRGRRTRR